MSHAPKMYAFALLLATWLAAAGSAAEPLYLQPPFDEIKLDEANGGALLRVEPLDFAGRKLPALAERKGDLEIELIDRPGDFFALPWINVAEIRFFEQMVLTEAEQAVRESRFDSAQGYFRFLEASYPQTPGLKEGVENFLWVQIGGAYLAARHAEALALLIELQRRNPQRQGLSTAYERVTLELVKQHLTDENYRAARGLLRNLARHFPDSGATAAAPLEKQLQDRARALLAEAQNHLAAGKPRDGYQASVQMLQVWPAIEGGQAAARAIHAQYPVVTVGVVEPAQWPSPARTLDDWADRRTIGLLARPLAEPAPDGAEGPPFHSPLGDLVRGGDSQQLTLGVAPNLTWLNPPRSLTAQDVARSLLARTDPSSPHYDGAWAGVVAQVEARGRDAVQIDFRRPQWQPEAWLQTPLWSPPGSPGTIAWGPYRLDEQLDQQAPAVARFVRQPASVAGEALPNSGQPSEVVERPYPDSLAGLRALLSGEITVLDRLSPWDLPRFANLADITIGSYGVPTVHLLVINPARPLLATRTARRALVYALDREGILQQGILGGQTLAGCETITGPLPKAVDGDNSVGYGYDAQVELRPYEPGTALVLLRMAREALSVEHRPPAGEPMKLVLSHPANPIARSACLSIARQLDVAGFRVALREQTAGEQTGGEQAADWDVRYAEVAYCDPLVDVPRVLGPQGLAGSVSPAMLAALRTLEGSTSRAEAAEHLRAIHRLAAAELPVIPLWQLVDHFVYHTSLKGIGERPATLYENIEQWQAELRIPAE
ncbi:MAG: ABC transporter substrate-binding protein [Pirellulaceae bacterium]